MKDRNGKDIIVGSKVIWYDPQVEYRDVKRVWEVADIYVDEDNGEDDDTIILIADDFGEAEVYANELEIV